jgi:transglutaminase-like putative cysteine protease
MTTNPSSPPSPELLKGWYFFSPTAWQRYFDSLPRQKPEESILLRVLVQLLVTVGIIATDIAAGTQMSLWAVPLSFVGGSWSWYRRYSRNVGVKFLLALGMLVAMGLFFQNIIAQLNDTRLVLAELLTQVQVLHTFDLPRRKDLGYSMVIGLILLGVAGTISQTMEFAPLLLVFLAIAIPTLIVDYRSQLKLQTQPSQFPPRNRQPRLPNYLSISKISLFLVVILASGLTLFVLMPRFPGYQLQTFPVNSPLNVDEARFQGVDQGIMNPGYQVGDLGQEQGGNGGRVDSRSYYGFSSQINQNLRGELVPQEVMRVRSQAPGFWRVLAFDRYTGQGWQISRDRQILRIQRPGWTYRFFLSSIFTKAKTKEVIQSYTAVSDLPNVIPALTHAREIFFPTLEVGLDPEGGIRSPLGLIDGFTYSVISDVAYRNQGELEQAGTTYPPVISRYYLQIPPTIAGEVKQKTEELLGRSPNPLTNPYQTSLFLAQRLKQTYRIQLDLPILKENEDLVTNFLRLEGGQPDHFATAYTMMLRSIGIPARLVAGFNTGEFNPFTGYYTVKNTDAFMMAEVYFPDYGWFTFNPLPGMELIPPGIEDTQTFSVLQQLWSWVAGWLPSPLTSFVSFVWETLARSISWVFGGIWALIFGSWLGLIAGGVGAIVLGFLGWLGWQRWRSISYALWLRKLPPMESIYQQMLYLQTRQGYPKPPAQTPLEYVQTCTPNLSADQTDIITEISQAYVAWRYGSQTPNTQRLRLRLRELQKLQEKWRNITRIKASS